MSLPVPEDDTIDFERAWLDLKRQAFGEGGLMQQRDSARRECNALRAEKESLEDAYAIMKNVADGRMAEIERLKKLAAAGTAEQQQVNEQLQGALQLVANEGVEAIEAYRTIMRVLGREQA